MGTLKAIVGFLAVIGVFYAAFQIVPPEMNNYSFQDDLRQVALSLSDTFCVERHRMDFLALVEHGVAQLGGPDPAHVAEATDQPCARVCWSTSKSETGSRITPVSST